MSFCLEDVLAARTHIKRDIHHTRLIHSTMLSKILACKVYIKPEFLQKTGSFKARGALNYIINDESGASEYTTFSSGNHGQAVAWAAASRDFKATIFMPEDASPAKVAAVKNYGGSVHFAGLSSNDRREACEAYAAEYGAHIIPPYDAYPIIAGQGSSMVEILEELPHFDAALIPAGGGGLLSGCSFVLNTLRPKIDVFACEAEAANDLQQSLQQDRLITIDYPKTIADGMRNLCVGDRNWDIIRTCVREGLTCSEAAIREAMGLYATYTKHFVEPTGSVTLATLMTHRERFRGKSVVLLASGGNIALSDYARLVSQDGRDPQ